jgi:hypothetical protein
LDERQETRLARASAKSAIAVEIHYGLDHWDGLERFLEPSLEFGDQRLAFRLAHLPPFRSALTRIFASAFESPAIRRSACSAIGAGPAVAISYQM